MKSARRSDSSRLPSIFDPPEAILFGLELLRFLTLLTYWRRSINDVKEIIERWSIGLKRYSLSLYRESISTYKYNRTVSKRREILSAMTLVFLKLCSKHLTRKICSTSGLTIETIRKRDRISGNSVVRWPVFGLIANGLRVAMIPTDNRMEILNRKLNNKGESSWATFKPLCFRKWWSQLNYSPEEHQRSM